jgi:hypothetical protein
MDEDLDQMTREELVNEVQKLRQGIRQHRDSSRHELCWHHPSLWGLLPEKTDPIPVIPEWPEFMRGCIRYRQSLDEQAPNAPRTNEPYEEWICQANSKQLRCVMKQMLIVYSIAIGSVSGLASFHRKLGIEPDDADFICRHNPNTGVFEGDGFFRIDAACVYQPQSSRTLFQYEVTQLHYAALSATADRSAGFVRKILGRSRVNAQAAVRP